MNTSTSSFHRKSIFILLLIVYCLPNSSAEELDYPIELSNNLNATITAPSTVCTGDSFTATVTHAGTPPFEYTWSPTAPNSSSVSFFAGLPGSQILSVVVTDANGCQSPTTEWNYEVIPVMQIPILSCCSVSVTELCICWAAVQGATGYDITVDGITIRLGSTTTEYCITGLNGGDEVDVTVTATSGNVCPEVFNNIICTTSLNVDNDGDGVFSDQDCDDNDANNYPGNIESCDGQDNNCDGSVDEGFPFSIYYLDSDGDSFGDPNTSLSDCENPDGYVLDNTDCDDTNPNVNPNATDNTSNGVDENCDGVDGTTAVSNLWNIEVTLWPNPANNILNIKINEEASFNLQIFNIYGQIINKYDTTKRIDISDLTQGSYMLLFTDKSSGNIYVERLVVVR